MANLGYVRVSTTEQNDQRQKEALAKENQALKLAEEASKENQD